MIELILLASLSPLNPISAAPAPVEPCVWPNTCASQVVAQVQPCVWPNTCAGRKDVRPAGTGGTSDTAGATQAVAQEPKAVAGFLPCGTPNKCKKVEVAEGPFQTCVWPNKCA
ncbi:MAG: hypothetical protein HY926_06460 [Elusimicrobia bacterium]|nr:hypothetical protein [Elusimicrobiota bacterium]